MNLPVFDQLLWYRLEDKIKKLEKRIHDLVDEACLAEASGDTQLGLEKAKEASYKERSLIRMQEQAGLNDSHNIDLTFLVNHLIYVNQSLNYLITSLPPRTLLKCSNVFHRF